MCIDGAFNTVTISPKPDVPPNDTPYIRTFIGIKLRIYGITYKGTGFYKGPFLFHVLALLLFEKTSSLCIARNTWQMVTLKRILKEL